MLKREYKASKLRGINICSMEVSVSNLTSFLQVDSKAISIAYHYNEGALPPTWACLKHEMAKQQNGEMTKRRNLQRSAKSD